MKKRYDAGLLPEAEWDVHARGFTASLDNPGGRWVSENVTITEDIHRIIIEHGKRSDGPRYGGLGGR